MFELDHKLRRLRGPAPDWGGEVTPQEHVALPFFLFITAPMC